VPVENGGRDYVFPHALPADPAQAARALPATPWMDDVTLEAALAGADAMGLGRGPQTDVLAVSLSTTDAVGHQYGMDSRELHDQVLRLDRSLGAFIDSLYKTRDSTRVVFALTGDHGMAPYPELHFPGTDPNRGRADLSAAFTAHNARLAARGVPEAFDVESGAITQDTAAFRRAGVDPRAALQALAADLRRVRGVQYVMLRDELPALAAQRQDTSAAKFARRWLHMIPPDLPVAAAVTLEPYAYHAGVTYATHGSPHDYDSNVPVLFHGAAFRPGRYGRFARVVDMAPTLAAVLGVEPTEALDGRVLGEALRNGGETAGGGGR
jgi:arylsulfatase A-like enzyme